MEIIQRDPQALDQALELLQNTVFSFSMKVCGHREDAEDTMQDVLLKTVPNLPRFDNAKALVVWLYRVAKNRCLMSRRRSKFAPKQHLSLDELMPDATEMESLSAGESVSPELALLRGEQTQTVRAAIHNIPAHYRLVLVLHDMEELSTAEIAEITGLSEVNVRVRLHRARLFLRKELVHASRRAAPTRSPRKRATRRTHKDAAGLSCKQMFAKLSDYVEGELDPAMCENIQKHMSGCKPCEAFLETLKTTIERTHSLPGPAADSKLAAELRKKLITQFQQAMAATQH